MAALPVDKKVMGETHEEGESIEGVVEGKIATGETTVRDSGKETKPAPPAKHGGGGKKKKGKR